MTVERDRTARRSYGAILFDLILVSFAALLVTNALGLRPGVGLVPLIVGIPTLAVAIVLLLIDLFPGLRLRGRGGDADQPAKPAWQTAIRAAAEEEEEVELETAPEARRRQAMFVGWILGFVALAVFTSFYIAMAVALVAIFVAIRLPWLQIVGLVAGTLAGFYALFHMLLNIRL